MGRMHAPINPGGGDPPVGAMKGDTCKRVTCPRCHEEFGNLPQHLRACDGGDE